MRVRVDAKLCTGHGRCYEIAPDTFTDDERMKQPMTFGAYTRSRASFFEGLSEIRFRRAKGRYESEDESGDDGDAGRDQKHFAVQSELEILDVKLGFAVGKQRNNETVSPNREEDTGKATE